MHPNIQEQLSTKNSYDNHIQKLSAIREGRKNSLRGNGFSARVRSNTNTHYPNSYNSQHAFNHVLPYNQLTHITEKKHETFINEFNRDKHKIEAQNLKLFQKLNKEMNRKSDKSNHYHYYSKASQPDYNYSKNMSNFSYQSSRMKSFYPVHDGKKTFNKLQNQKNVDRENQRLKYKIKSCSSSLSYSKLMSGQKNRQKLRSRILRYDERLELKSSKFIKPLTAGNSTNQTTRFHQNNEKKTDGKRINSARVKIGQFYDFNEIKKNRIEHYRPKISNLQNPKTSNNKMITSKKTSGLDPNYGKPKNNYFKNERLRGRSFFTTEV